jgi:hypothetical protein
MAIKYPFIIIIFITLLIFLLIAKVVHEDFQNIIPIPPPNYYEYARPNYPVNQYAFNTVPTPFVPSYLNEVPPQMSDTAANAPPFYPNYTLGAAPTLIGCGSRREPCLGGTQRAIVNMMPPINISNQNIAPVNIALRGFDGGLQQLGTIQKVFGADNYIYPLFGMRLWNNGSNKYRYYTKFGKFGVILPIYQRRGHGEIYEIDELGTNDPVFIEGQKDEYRVIIYDADIPQYIGMS